MILPLIVSGSDKELLSLGKQTPPRTDRTFWQCFLYVRHFLSYENFTEHSYKSEFLHRHTNHF